MLFMSCLFFMLSRLFIATLWPPAAKGLTSWLLFVMFNCAFVTFPCSILGQVWYLTWYSMYQLGLNHISHLRSKKYARRYSQVYVVLSPNVGIQCQAWDPIPNFVFNTSGQCSLGI